MRSAAINRFQREFMIFTNEDSGFEEGKKPSGYTKLEIRDGKGRLSVVIQNLRDGKDRFRYALYLIRASLSPVEFVRVGDISYTSGRAEGSKAELEWKFDPLRVAGTTYTFGEFDTVAVLVEYAHRIGDSVVCPLAVYRKGHRNWRSGLREAIRNNQAEDRANEQVAEQIEEHVAEQIEEHVAEQIEEQVVEQIEEQVAEQIEEQVAEQIEEHVVEQIEEQVVEQIEEHVVEQIEEHVAEQTEEHVVEQIEEHVAEQTEEQPAKQQKTDETDQVAQYGAEHGSNVDPQYSMRSIPDLCTNDGQENQYPSYWEQGSEPDNQPVQEDAPMDETQPTPDVEHSGVIKNEIVNGPEGKQLTGEYTEQETVEEQHAGECSVQEREHKANAAPAYPRQETQDRNSTFQGNLDYVNSDCVYLNSNMCGAFIKSADGMNPCGSCRINQKNIPLEAQPQWDPDRLREVLDSNFEINDPFHSRRSDYMWWRVTNPVNLNNILYQNNIRSPLMFNPAVMMAHYKYRHLIVGIFTHKNGQKYVVCGVPGMHMVDMKPFGDMNRWAQADGNRLRYGAFGYWLVYINPNNGKIIDFTKQQFMS